MHWHKAVDSYFEPNDFRVAINSCIQELRNVTFVLQSNKRDIPEFDSWYGPWQQKMRANSGLRWLIDARNYIVKQGDLELCSKLRIEVIGSYLADEIPIFEEDFNPSLTNEEIYAKTISMGLPSEVFENSYVKIQRRWIDQSYPDHELVELLSECWSAVIELLLDAPSAVTTEERQLAKPKLPPCMHDHLRIRSILMKVSKETLVPALLSSEHVSIDDKKREKLQELYGDTPLFLAKSKGTNLSSTSFKEQCQFFFEQAKAVLKKDSYHIHLAIIFVQKKLAQIVEIRNADRADKYITTLDLASKMERIGADSVIIVSEAWNAPFDPSNPYRGAAESPQRQEILMLFGATNVGEGYCFTVPFFRSCDDLSYGEQTISDAKNMNALQPFFTMWKQQKRAKNEID